MALNQFNHPRCSFLPILLPNLSSFLPISISSSSSESESESSSSALFFLCSLFFLVLLLSPSHSVAKGHSIRPSLPSASDPASTSPPLGSGIMSFP
ncbi:unnamed protein product [Musa acuminata subsp. malaccensis]|uniref:(wild Malaysian banana) hypothetical protein n=1 Tax=Musa acuminata subsp. malaccensis TaxID=214687 RepID=A0A8D6ZWH4_MUSAM|nr:unnamed protein product [Musa acuminata subsp. malaccensis]